MRMTGEALSDLVWSFTYKSCSACFRVSSGRCFTFAGKLVCFKQILTCVSSKRPDDVEQSVFWCISNQASLFSAHLNSAKMFVIHPDHLMSLFHFHNNCCSSLISKGVATADITAYLIWHRFYTRHPSQSYTLIYLGVKLTLGVHWRPTP